MSLAIDLGGVIVPCTSCGRKNRIPFGRDAKCAHCHAPLPAPGEPLEISSTAAFDALVASTRAPIVVDFWAPWCGPCRMVSPEIAKVARAQQGRWLVAKVNTDALPDLAGRYGIQSIPTMAVFAGGREVSRTSGARPASEIEAFVRSAIVTASS
jgi:thioredoxin 2